MPAMTNARRNAVIGIVVAAVLGSIISTLEVTAARNSAACPRSPGW